MASRSDRPKRFRGLRWALLSLLAVVVILVGAGAVFLATFDPSTLKPRIEAAVKQATGRDLALNGDIGLALSLQPTITVHDATLANPPGFSRPEMIKLERVDLKLGLLPLLSRRIEITRLALVKPDILLEKDAQGRDNWEFVPIPAPAAAVAPGAPATAASDDHPSARIAVAELRIENGNVAYRDGGTGQVIQLGFPQMRLTAASPTADLHVEGATVYNGATITVTGQTGPLTRLQTPADTSPFPLKLALAGSGATMTADGVITDPLHGRGYSLKLTGQVPDLTTLQPFTPKRQLPALRDVRFAATVTDVGSSVPQVSDISLHAGASDLTASVRGLKLEVADFQAPRLDQPVKILVKGTLGNAPLVVNASSGAVTSLINPTDTTQLPLDADVQAGANSITAKGSMTLGAKPILQVNLTGTRIDLDALASAVGELGTAPAASTAAPVAGSPAPAAAPPAPKSARTIPDTPLPLDLLRRGNADVTLKLDELRWDGVSYKPIAVRAVLQGGKLQVDPFTVGIPVGRLEGSATLDANQTPPTVAVRLHAPGLALHPLLVALRQPAYANGNLEVYADLRGSGETTHALAATVTGTLGLAMVNGTIDNRLLGSSLGGVLREVNMLDLVGRGGASQIRCFAARLDAQNGVGTFRTLVLSSSLLTMDGGGWINFGNETLDLHVRPRGRIGGTEIVVPLRISGSLRSPSTASDPAATVVANAGSVAGAVLGNATPLGLVAGALAGQKVLGGGEDCSAALAVARGQSAGVVQEAAQPAPAQAQAKPPNPGQLLRQLFR